MSYRLYALVLLEGCEQIQKRFGRNVELANRLSQSDHHRMPRRAVVAARAVRRATSRAVSARCRRRRSRRRGRRPSGNKRRRCESAAASCAVRRAMRRRSFRNASARGCGNRLATRPATEQGRRDSGPISQVPRRRRWTCNGLYRAAPCSGRVATIKSCISNRYRRTFWPSTIACWAHCARWVESWSRSPAAWTALSWHKPRISRSATRR